jgi:hypothetical protein
VHRCVSHSRVEHEQVGSCRQRGEEERFFHETLLLG